MKQDVKEKKTSQQAKISVFKKKKRRENEIITKSHTHC